MFRFTIRELVLLTLVVAMGVGWWIERSRAERRAVARERHWRAYALEFGERLAIATHKDLAMTTPDGERFYIIGDYDKLLIP